MKSLLALPNPFSHCTPAQSLVREPSDYCPGCNTRLGCVCPSAEHEDAVIEAFYALGLDHGAADGTENRPTRSWLVKAGVDPDEYLAGYDAGCARVARGATEDLPAAVACEPATAYAPTRTTRRTVTTRAVRKTGPSFSEAEIRSRRVATEAERWLAFAGERTRMRPETLLSKTIQSACFSVETGASSFAVPSKLALVREHQRRLWALVRDGYDRYERLELDTAASEGIRVTRGDEILGEVQAKHAPWVRPLIAFGLTVHLGRVTGHETEGHTLGVNIVFGGVGRALAALAEALGSAAAASGDGASGDGAPAGLRLVVPETIPNTAGPNTAEEAADVVLWRNDRGSARASVGTTDGAALHHIVRHSPTGIEWGYGGSGPSDLALSVLTAIAGADAAERHYRALVAEVVSRVPRGGGVLRAERVRAWLRRQEASLSEAAKPESVQTAPTRGRAAA